MADYDVFNEAEMHRSRVMQTRENTARAARSYAMYTTTGTGEVQVAAPFMFDCTFVQQPGFTSGVSMVQKDPGGELNPILVDTHFPRVTAGVWDWVTVDSPAYPGDETKQFYTGAYVYFTVDTVTPASTSLGVQPVYVLQHTLAFEGIAFKSLSRDLLAGGVPTLISAGASGTVPASPANPLPPPPIPVPVPPGGTAPPPVPPGGSPPPIAGMIDYTSYPQITGPRFTPNIQKPAGRVLITAAGTYSGWKMDAGSYVDIQVASGTVILEDFILDARGTNAGGPIWVRAGFGAAVEVRYGTVIGAGNVSSTGVNMLQPNGYAHHLNISNTEDGFRCGVNTIIEANWVHNLYQGSGSHNDCLQLQGTESNVEIRYNRFDAPYRSENAALFIKADTGNITGVNAHHNYFHGGGYSVYVYDNAGTSTGIQLDDNVWIRNSYTYANLVTYPVVSPNTQITSKARNKYDDGSLITVWG